jgi:hypothetical protein
MAAQPQKESTDYSRRLNTGEKKMKERPKLSISI